MTTFSERHGLQPAEAPAPIRDEAPEGLREAIWTLSEVYDVSPLVLAPVIVEMLPCPFPWLRKEEVYQQAGHLLATCEWYRVFDVAEVVYRLIGERRNQARFERDINDYLLAAGIAWKMARGKVEARATAALESVLHDAASALEGAERRTAAAELREAHAALSRRPEPNLTGAVQHAGAAIECLARDVSGERSATLGKIIKQHPHLFPPPLDKIAEGVWGYLSERGRHLQEGRAPQLHEAMMCVGLAASLAAYLDGRDAAEHDSEDGSAS